jgi:hypothetical protein
MWYSWIYAKSRKTIWFVIIIIILLSEIIWPSKHTKNADKLKYDLSISVSLIDFIFKG